MAGSGTGVTVKVPPKNKVTRSDVAIRGGVKEDGAEVVEIDFQPARVEGDAGTIEEWHRYVEDVVVRRADGARLQADARLQGPGCEQSTDG